MKNTIIAIAVAVVLVLGYFFFINKPSTLDTNNTADTSSKLDMNVVCASALAYMSFPDAAAADLFVEECKDGKYPEVLERYKADMNLGSGAAI